MKNISRILLLLTLCFQISSCKKGTVTPGVRINTELDLWVRNAAGKNLLDPNTPGYYKAEEIKLFYLQNGQKTEVFNPALDAPRNFLILKNESNGEYYIRVFPYSGDQNQSITTTYIQWREADTDTVRVETSGVGTNVLDAEKVFYNEILKYDAATMGPTTWGIGIYPRLIEITK